jgi:NTE family protein
MAEHAYQQTRALLKLRAGRLAPQLARHGITIDHAALADPQRRLIDTRMKPADSAAAARLHRVLDELQRRLPHAA